MLVHVPTYTHTLMLTDMGALYSEPSVSLSLPFDATGCFAERERETDVLTSSLALGSPSQRFLH